MSELILHHYWRSTSSYRVRIALGYKGLAYQSRFVNLLKGEQKTATPSGYIPCLEVDGERFIESVAIIEMLEELHPSPALYPKEPKARAHVRALVETINAGTQPLQNLSVLDHLSSDKEVRLAWLRKWIPRGLAVFEAQCTEEGPFSFGASFTAADAFLVPQLYGARRFDIDLTPYPRAVRAEQAALALPFVDAARPEKQADAVL